MRSVNNVFACMILLSSIWQIQAIMDRRGLRLLSEVAREWREAKAGKVSRDFAQDKISERKLERK